ncbi:MAG: hypothetical protein Q9181_008134, partial [Wetmoreana brouardii]
LLLKILETSNINADVKAISETWTAGDDKPTPRAIQERLFKIRSMSKGKGNGTFTVTGTVRTNGSSAKSSPANGGKMGVSKAAPKTPSKTAAKRKHGML